VTDSIQSVSAATRSSGQIATDVLESARQLAAKADLLHEEVDSFLAAIKDEEKFTHSEDLAFADFVRTGATDLAHRLEAAIERGEISPDHLFDEFYQPIPDTTPQQVMRSASGVSHTKFWPRCELAACAIGNKRPDTCTR